MTLLAINGADVEAKRLGLQISPTLDFIEWIELGDRVRGLTLNPHTVNPSLVVVDGGGGYRIHGLNPDSLLHVRPGTTFAVRELSSIAVGGADG